MEKVMKVFAVKSLLPGMLVGRTVYDGDSDDIIVEAGETIDVNIIQRLKDKNIISLYVYEDSIRQAMAMFETAQSAANVAKIVDAQIAVIDQMDDEFTNSYYRIYFQTEKLLDRALQARKLDEDTLHDIMESGTLQELYREPAKAVSMLLRMEEKGQYNVHHAVRVAVFAGLISRWLNFSARERQNLVLAGLLMDIGKQRIDKGLLNKKGRLTPNEFKIVQKHIDYGLEVIQNSSLNKKKELMDGIKQHHERMDGSGYPEGLKGNEISRFGKILAILDTYDAMSSSRAHDKRRSPFDVLKIIDDEVLRKKLDSEFAIVFIRKIYSSFNGSWVRLTDESIGRIVYVDENRVRAYPMVQLTNGEVIDLNTVTDVSIQDVLTEAELETLEL